MKKVGTAMYVHKTNVQELSAVLSPSDYLTLTRLLRKAGGLISFEIVKYDKGNISLIDSPDWNTENEPTVGDSYRWKAGEVFDRKGNLIPPTVRRYNPENPQIYHSKWMFVDPSYGGFDYNKAVRRSALWQSTIPNTKEVKSRIGYRRYWNHILAKYGLPE